MYFSINFSVCDNNLFIYLQCLFFSLFFFYLVPGLRVAAHPLPHRSGSVGQQCTGIILDAALIYMLIESQITDQFNSLTAAADPCSFGFLLKTSMNV